MKSKSITVVIPVFNEEENIDPLVDQLAGVYQTLSGLSVLLVNDGSADGTRRKIDSAAERLGDWCRGLHLETRQGQSAALLAGLHACDTDILVTMDGDLQNDPADIPLLMEALDGWDVVCGFRAERRDTWSRRVGSRLANRVRNWVTRDGVRDTGCSLKAFRRECLADLPPLDGVHRFMPAYFRLNGRTIRELPVHHRPREHGVSKYTNLKRLPRTLLDLAGFWWYQRRHLSHRKGSVLGFQ